MEKAMKLKSRVKSAMTYPAIVLVVAVAVVALLLVYVIPVFKKLFESMGGQLPGPTQFLIDVSEFTQSYFLFMIGFLAVFVYLFRRYYRTEKGRRTVDALVLKAPVFGPLIKKVAVAKFTRTLSTMLGSGVPILEGLSIVSKTAGNVIIESAIMKTRQSISEGRTIAEPLAETDIFPPMVVQMIAVGEATGALDAMLEKIADFYDDEVDTAVGALTTMLEPFMMVFLGVVVGGMIICMYLPIFKMAAVVAG
jgi:type IV pilus assembly protein PilC